MCNICSLTGNASVAVPRGFAKQPERLPQKRVQRPIQCSRIRSRWSLDQLPSIKQQPLHANCQLALCLTSTAEKRANCNAVPQRVCLRKAPTECRPYSSSHETAAFLSSGLRLACVLKYSTMTHTTRNLFQVFALSDAALTHGPVLSHGLRPKSSPSKQPHFCPTIVTLCSPSSKILISRSRCLLFHSNRKNNPYTLIEQVYSHSQP